MKKKRPEVHVGILTNAHPPNRFAALRGTRKTGMSTDEIMNLLRGYDKDARDPGFRTSGK